MVAGPQSNRGYLPVGQEERLEAAFPRDSQSVREAIEGYLNFSDYPPAEWPSSDLLRHNAPMSKESRKRFRN